VTGSSLPRKLEDLRGCLARRYVRVSSEEQGWKYGPDGQNLTIDEAIDRAGLQESGQPFLDEQSAWRNSGERPALQALLSASLHGQYKVLVVAYFSRWSRDAEVALRIRRELHAAGVALYFADEGFLSTDENAHERYLDEAIAAEKFSHRLSRTIKRTHAAKFERYGDQAGSPGLGFYRTPQPMARLAIDSDTMPRVIALYVRYARGDISYRALAREMGAYSAESDQPVRGFRSPPSEAFRLSIDSLACRHRQLMRRPGASASALVWPGGSVPGRCPRRRRRGQPRPLQRHRRQSSRTAASTHP